MATITALNRPNGQCRGGLYSAINYVMQDKKTVWNGEKLVSGQNCIPKFSFNEMMTTKHQWNKTDGKFYFHFVHSFSDKENITPKEAHEIAVEFAKHWKGFEVVIATHVDTDNAHTHFIINSVNCETGKKYHCDQSEIKRLHELNDELCRKYGYSITEKKEEGVMPYSGAEYHTAMRGESWKVNLQLAIDNAMRYATNRHSFFELMESEGYSVRWTRDRKNITYTCPNGKKCRDNKLHEKKYLKEMMEYELYARRKYFEGVEEHAEITFGSGERHGTRSGSDREELVGYDKAHERYPESANEDGRNDRGLGNVAGRAESIDEPGEGSSVGGAEINRGNEVGTSSVPESFDETIRRILDGDFRTGWEEERGTLLSLLESSKQSGKMGKKTSLDKSHSFGGGSHIGSRAAYLAGNLSNIIDDFPGEDFSDDDDIDKRLREEIRRIKNGENIEM